ncbi:hypothetical protein NK6_764 [Bradyrhizobium diazoefficiens]|uniref:Uncharacterized protein n=1 Tax=Bradyrhizobium diazoefficiens TaxID=1355477 RepID=A0A0E4FQG7_9BRAD|nr:hypothetical protein NK6_764 [Bradyrhizobium diazoefficiens]
MIPKPAAPFRHSALLLHCNTTASTAIRRKMKAVSPEKLCRRIVRPETFQNSAFPY